MKIIMERDALSKALSTASHMLPTKPTIPILGNVLVEVANNRATFKGCNLDMQTTVSVACDVEGEGPAAITLPGKLAAATVNGLPKGAQCSIEWDDGRSATLRAGKCRYKLHALPASDFPDFTPPDDATRFKFGAKNLADALNTIEFAIADDQSRMYLNGAYWGITKLTGHAGLGGHKGARLVFVATDARELGFIPFEVPDDAKDMPGVIVPDQAINEMIRLIADVDGDVDLAVAEARVTLSVGDVTISTKIIDATYPSPGYMDVIPREGFLDVVVDVAELDSALSRLIGLGEGTRVTLAMTSSAMTLGLVNHQAGEAEERIDVTWRHPDLFKRINANGFLKVLRRLKTELCLIRFTDAGKPILFNEYMSEKMATHRTFLSMPMEGS